MGSRLNMKPFVDGVTVSDEVYNPKQPVTGGGSSLPLARQNSVFSLTFDEFQNSWGGGIGKDFGSMNMDELLKSIWTAEETHSITSNNNMNAGNSGGNALVNNNGGGLPYGVGVGLGEGSGCGGGLQRQGSLTLPRTLSQKTVDDVWKELMKDDDTGNGVCTGGASVVPQRQQTLGEMTLQEFLFRAGVVREESQPQPVERLNNFYGFGSNADIGPARNGFGPNQPHGYSGSVAAVRPNLQTIQTQPLQMQRPQKVQQPQQLMQTQERPDLLTIQTQPLQMQQPQHLMQRQERPNLQAIQTQPLQLQQPQQLMQTQKRPFPKQTTFAFSNSVDVVNRSQPVTECQEVKPSILGIRNHPMNNGLLQAVDYKTGVTVAAVSPGSQMSPDLTPKSAMDASLAPVPYVFGRARRTGAVLEKVIERRQKRMIKNRESAARSRARKQAYTLELEAEVAQLKELNEELQRKQVEIMEKQKKQLLEPLLQPLGCKRQCLRRTLTGPW